MSRDLGHARFGVNYLRARSASPRRSGIPNLKSLAKAVLKMFDCMPKIEGSRDLGHAPFGENYLIGRLALPGRSGGPNLMSLAQVVLKICSIVCQKLRGHVT